MNTDKRKSKEKNNKLITKRLKIQDSKLIDINEIENLLSAACFGINNIVNWDCAKIEECEICLIIIAVPNIALDEIILWEHVQSDLIRNKWNFDIKQIFRKYASNHDSLLNICKRNREIKKQAKELSNLNYTFSKFTMEKLATDPKMFHYYKKIFEKYHLENNFQFKFRNIFNNKRID